MYKKYFTDSDLLINKIKSINIKEIDLKTTKNKFLGFICSVFMISSIGIVFIASKNLFLVETLDGVSSLMFRLIVSFILGTLIGVIPSLFCFGISLLNIWNTQVRRLYVEMNNILPNAYFKYKPDLNFRDVAVIKMGNISTNGHVLYWENPTNKDYILLRNLTTIERYRSKSSHEVRSNILFSGLIVELPLILTWLSTDVRIYATHQNVLGTESMMSFAIEDTYMLDFESTDFNGSYNVYSSNKLVATRLVTPEVINVLNEFRNKYNLFAIHVESTRVSFAFPSEVLSGVFYSKETIDELHSLVNSVFSIRNTLSRG